MAAYTRLTANATHLTTVVRAACLVLLLPCLRSPPLCAIPECRCDVPGCMCITCDRGRGMHAPTRSACSASRRSSSELHACTCLHHDLASAQGMASTARMWARYLGLQQKDETCPQFLHVDTTRHCVLPVQATHISLAAPRQAPRESPCAAQDMGSSTSATVESWHVKGHEYDPIRYDWDLVVRALGRGREHRRDVRLGGPAPASGCAGRG